MTFDKEFLDGMFDALISYLQASGVREYTITNREGWRISFKRKEEKK